MEFPAVMEVFCSYVVQLNKVVTSTMCVLSTWKIASVTEDLNFSVYVNLNLNSHMWLMAITLDSIALGFYLGLFSALGYL